MKTVLVTGANGFVGRNLVQALKSCPDTEVLTFTRSTSRGELLAQLSRTDVVFHLAGVNRPLHEGEFTVGNMLLTRELCSQLRRVPRKPKIVFASSIQAGLDNPYGNSKREAEQELKLCSSQLDVEVVIYRLKNVFGKWCRPNYNSVVATFCHNRARDLPITISNPAHEVDLVYIDDVVASFLGEMNRGPAGVTFKDVPISHKVTLQTIADLTESFRTSRKTLVVPNLVDPFTVKLYATYLSYLPEDGFGYQLDKKIDLRGDLAEFVKSNHFGQLFVSRTKPGITRGNHFHHTKTEKFLVLEGDAVIRFRHVDRDDVIEYPVCGRDLKVIDIPPGYTHSIQNIGSTEMVVLFWASEIFNSQKPDTYFTEVIRIKEDRDEGRHDHRHAA